MRDMPHSLSSTAVGAPVHRLAEPIPVTAWIVDKLGRDVLVEGEATAWSPRAGFVRFIDRWAARGSRGRGRQRSSGARSAAGGANRPDGDPDTSGRCPGGPLHREETQAGEAVATMDLFKGAIGLFKNPASHRRVDLDDATEAAEIVLLADLLMRILDRLEDTSPS
jgi:Protein of unknown function (Hypoth_ymh)